MPRPRKPSNVMELAGAFDKNPQRRREEPKVDLGLGDPPDYFEADEIDVWCEIETSAPEGVLAKSDRLCVEMLVPLILQLRRREPMKGRGPILHAFDVNPYRVYACGSFAGSRTKTGRRKRRFVRFPRRYR